MAAAMGPARPVKGGRHATMRHLEPPEAAGAPELFAPWSAARLGHGRPRRRREEDAAAVWLCRRGARIPPGGSAGCHLESAWGLSGVRPARAASLRQPLGCPWPAAPCQPHGLLRDNEVALGPGPQLLGLPCQGGSCSSSVPRAAAVIIFELQRREGPWAALPIPSLPRTACRSSDALPRSARPFGAAGRAVTGLAYIARAATPECPGRHTFDALLALHCSIPAKLSFASDLICRTRM